MTPDCFQPCALGLPRGLRNKMIEYLRAALPCEACGFLVRDASGRRRFVPARNSDPDPAHAYTVEPLDLIRVFRDAEASGEAVTAVVHSHPQTLARPSARDASQWFYPELAMVLVSFAGGRARIRGWRAVSPGSSRRADAPTSARRRPA